MNLAVQVDVGEAAECEHPEGEVAGCGVAILQHLHCAVSWVRTPRDSNLCTVCGFSISNLVTFIAHFFLLLVNNQAPEDVIVHLVDGRGPAIVKHKSNLTAVKLIHLHCNIELLVHF